MVLLRKIVLPVFSVAMLLGTGLSLSAQEEPRDATDTPPMLYRGRVARKYPSDFNGTPYWDTLSFRTGKVMYNGRLYEDVQLRIDAALGKLVVRQDGKMAPTNPDERQVSWFTRGKELYVNLNYQGIKTPNSFYQLVSDSEKPVFRCVTKILRSNTASHNGALIGYRDPGYDDKLTSFYEYKESWWTIENGRLVRLRARKAARLKERSRQDGSYSSALFLWHPVEGTGSELVPPGIKRANVISLDGLPAGYFSEQPAVSAIEQTSEARYKNKVYIIGTPGGGAKARLSGIVTDDEGKALEGVVVIDEGTGNYARSDAYGRYSLVLPVGETFIIFNDADKEEQKLNVVLNGDGGLNVSLHDRSTLLDGAMISAESMRQHRSSETGVEKISAKTISKIPTVFGENDILKVVLTLPGVQTVGEASAGFNVRGGSTDQNLILYNGNTIYYPTHFFGINSVFNPDLVDGVELYKGSIPAEFGGRISSVLDVSARHGNASGFKGSLGLGLLTSRFHVEGPLTKAKTTTYTLGARTSYSDWLLGFLPAKSEFSGGSAGFYDANLGITHKSGRNTFQAFAYLSSDSFAFGADTTFSYGNANASLHWQHDRDSVLMKASVGFDHYDNRVDEEQDDTEAYRLTTAINQVFARFNLRQRKNERHTFNYGGEAILYMLDGGHRRPLGESSLVVADDLPTEVAFQPSLYFSDKWSPSQAVSVDAGLRLAGYIGEGAFYAYPELRLSGRYSFTPVFSLKGGINTMSQYIHLISNTSSISPMDTWKMTDSEIRPTTGWQASGGAYWTVLGGKLDLSAESYYKRLRNYLDYGQAAELVMNHHLADDVVATIGKSYGLELMAKKSVGRLNGWISYTWSRSLLRDTGFDGVTAINGGRWYRSSTDKPHDFKLVGNYAFTSRYSISVTIDYSTGRPISFPVGYYSYANGFRLAYSGRNTYRIPDYFRVDVAYNIDAGHYLKAFAHASVTIGCYNVTGRKNAYSVFYDTNRGSGMQAYKLSIFATQVPYVNINFLF